MSDAGIIPTTERLLAEALRRIENLERRAPLFDSSHPTYGCCALYCCSEQPFTSLTTIGQSTHACTIDVDEPTANGTRLLCVGLIMIRATEAGTMNMLWGVEVEGTVYAQQPQESHTVANGDLYTVPVHNVIDSAVPDPTVSVFIQNVGVTDTRIDAVSFSVQVFTNLEGSVSCGTVAGT